MWSGLFPSIPTYHCFGEAYIKSERLAARSRAFQVMTHPSLRTSDPPSHKTVMCRDAPSRRTP